MLELLSSARFTCALSLVDASGEQLYGVEESCEGYIIGTPRGTEGFGYDPLFYIPAFGRTMAELTAEEKNECSHRGRAMRSLLARMQAE